MEEHTLINVNNYLKTNIYSYLDTSGGQSSNLYLNVVNEKVKKNSFHFHRMRLCHPPDGSTSPKYKLLCFIKTEKNCKEKNELAFNRDRCCHLVLCLRLIPFHYFITLPTKVCECFRLQSKVTTYAIKISFFSTEFVKKGTRYVSCLLCLASFIFR